MANYVQLQQDCTNWKSEGDVSYREHRFQDAINYYSDIINGLETSAASQRMEITSLPQDLLDLLYIAHSNRCASYLQIKDFVPALTDAQRCVQYQPYWAKGYARLGMCYHKLNRLSEAIAAYEQVISLEENNLDAKVNLEKLRTQFQQQQQKERERQNAHQANGRSTRYSSSSSSHGSSSGSSSVHTNRSGFGGSTQPQPTATMALIDRIKATLQQWIDRVQSYDYMGTMRNLYYRLMSSWLSLAPETRQYVIYAVVGLLLYYFFFYRSSSGSGGGGYGRRYYDPDLDDDYYHRSSYSGYGGSRGLSWSAWAMIMFAAYKVPPMFPDQLGHYARPFFGMNWTTFMWLLNMFTNNRNMGGFSRGFFGGPRRRYY
jgi:tetratricopeptide (TPR) repeat protein